jgi:hypothetical protein
MKSAYLTIHPGKNPPPQNDSWLNSFFPQTKSTDFTSSTFLVQPDFSQNQPAAITQNTGSPQTSFGKEKEEEWSVMPARFRPLTLDHSIQSKVASKSSLWQ